VLVTPGQDEGLVDALEALMRDPERGYELGRTGRQAVCQKFSDKVMAAATLREYERWVCTS
jgi:glycosyltransferase involved in cell wall biosynthesis